MVKEAVEYFMKGAPVSVNEKEVLKKAMTSLFTGINAGVLFNVVADPLMTTHSVVVPEADELSNQAFHVLMAAGNEFFKIVSLRSNQMLDTMFGKVCYFESENSYGAFYFNGSRGTGYYPDYSLCYNELFQIEFDGVQIRETLLLVDYKPQTLQEEKVIEYLDAICFDKDRKIDSYQGVELSKVLLLKNKIADTRNAYYLIKKENLREI